MRLLRFIWYFLVAVSRRWSGMELPEALPPLVPPPPRREIPMTGNRNIAFGYDALRRATSDSRNTALGYRALQRIK